VSISLLRTTDGPASTQALAGRLARLARPGDVLLLIGGLGAGKTTFAQGFAAALGVTGPVTSPTFTLLRQYEVTGARACASSSTPTSTGLSRWPRSRTWDWGAGRGHGCGTRRVGRAGPAALRLGLPARRALGGGRTERSGDPATGSEGHDERRTVRITAVDDAWAGRLAELGAEGPAVVVEAAP